MQYKRQLAGVQTIFLTMILIIGTLTAFGVLIDWEQGTLFSLEFDDPIIISVIGLFAICVPLSRRLFRVHMEKEFYVTARELFGRYLSGLAIRAVTVALAGLFAAIVYLFSRNLLGGVLAVTALLLILKDFPVKNRILNTLRITARDLKDPEKINES